MDVHSVDSGARVTLRHRAFTGAKKKVLTNILEK
jgi:hypothetical protein